VATTGLWLFSSAAAGRDGGDAYDGVRARAIRVLPRVALGLSVVGVVCAGLLGELVPRFAGETDTLRMLFAAFPLLAFNGLELYVRSARGRNAGVLMVGALALVANVGLCLWLVPTYGLVGAAGALLVAEGLQTLAIIATTRPAERMVVVPVGATVLLSTCVPAAFAVMVGSAVAAVVLAVSAFAVLAVVRVGRRVPQQVGVE
jgi:O-antigen/teichoic acid export membrane protein